MSETIPYRPSNDTLPIDSLQQWLRTGDVRALSIRQPWAHRILHEGKDIENRSRRTSLRGWFLIHASQSRREDAELIDRRKLSLGGIVGAARITGCIDESSSKWWIGPVGYALEDPIEIDLVPCAGQLGFWRVRDELLDQVRASVAAAARVR